MPDPKGSLRDFQLLQHTKYQLVSLVQFAIEIWPIWREIDAWLISLLCIPSEQSCHIFSVVLALFLLYMHNLEHSRINRQR